MTVRTDVHEPAVDESRRIAFALNLNVGRLDITFFIPRLSHQWLDAEGGDGLFRVAELREIRDSRGIDRYIIGIFLWADDVMEREAACFPPDTAVANEGTDQLEVVHQFVRIAVRKMFAVWIDDHDDIWIGEGGAHLFRRFQNGDGHAMMAERVIMRKSIRPFFYGGRRPTTVFRAAFQRDDTDDSSFVIVWIAFDKMIDCRVQQAGGDGDAAVRVGIAVARDAEQPSFSAEMGSRLRNAVWIFHKREIRLAFLRRSRDA